MDFASLRYIKGLIITVIIILFSFAALPALAQTEDSDEECSLIVQTALESTREVCDGTERNEACYGNTPLEAQPKPGVSNFTFNQQGDREEVADIQTLRLSSMNIETGAWGIALLELQASIPDSLPENVTMLLFGNVEISDASNQEPILITGEISSTSRVYLGASLDSTVVNLLEPGTAITATGRSSDATWVRIRYGESGTGWVAANVLALQDDIQNLRVTDPTLPDTPQFGPMQAFTFHSSRDDAPCEAAPDSGLLIQTPEGVGQVRMLVNEVVVNVGSTVFFTGGSDDSDMDISTLDGLAVIIIDGVRYFIPAGSWREVPIDEDFQISGKPGDAQPYPGARFEAVLNFSDLLPGGVDIQLITQEELDFVLDYFEGNLDPDDLTDEQQAMFARLILGDETLDFDSLTDEEFAALFNQLLDDLDEQLDVLDAADENLPSGVGGAEPPG